jgi:hypothetical protein
VLGSADRVARRCWATEPHSSSPTSRPTAKPSRLPPARRSAVSFLKTTSHPSGSGLTSSDPIGGGRFVPGQILAGRYRIVALAGRGGMGEVYRADDLTLSQTVAIKFLPVAFYTRSGRLGSISFRSSHCAANCAPERLSSVRYWRRGRHALSHDGVRRWRRLGLLDP